MWSNFHYIIYYFSFVILHTCTLNIYIFVHTLHLLICVCMYVRRRVWSVHAETICEQSNAWLDIGNCELWLLKCHRYMNRREYIFTALQVFYCANIYYIINSGKYVHTSLFVCCAWDVHVYIHALKLNGKTVFTIL